jgi:DNA-binding NarL/FixJ family response regulator
MTDLPSKQIFVVGANSLQNELIAFNLSKETSFPCSILEDLDRVKSRLEKNPAERTSLALYDCTGKNEKTCLADLKAHGFDHRLMVCLFNLARGKKIENEALSYGARGFFYSDEPFILLLKGVLGVFKGEFWISRQALSDWVEGQSPLPVRAKHPILSGREREILTHLARGATNQEIAGALFISEHTVKNHLQKIFKKVNVHSKTEAALWAARYL